MHVNNLANTPEQSTSGWEVICSILQPGEGPTLFQPGGSDKNIPRKDVFAWPNKTKGGKKKQNKIGGSQRSGTRELWWHDTRDRAKTPGNTGSRLVPGARHVDCMQIKFLHLARHLPVGVVECGWKWTPFQSGDFVLGASTLKYKKNRSGAYPIQLYTEKEDNGPVAWAVSDEVKMSNESPNKETPKKQVRNLKQESQCSGEADVNTG